LEGVNANARMSILRILEKKWFIVADYEKQQHVEVYILIFLNVLLIIKKIYYEI